MDSRGRLSTFSSFVVSKGMELFIYRKKELSFNKSFITTIDAFEIICSKDEAGEEINLLFDLREFYSKYFDATNLGRAQLKSQLYVIANFGKGGKPFIKTEIKEELRKICPYYIKNLPGHKEPEKISKHGINWFSHWEPEYSHLLDKLIDRHAFSYFHFLSLNN